MKIITRALLGVLLSYSAVSTAPLDGTSSLVYQSTQYLFADTDTVTGFVHLAAGCSIPDSATVTFNTPTLQRGEFNCSESGVVQLADNLHLDAGVTFPEGVTIDGQDKTVFLYGNLEVPAAKKIKIISNTTIDGLGHTVNLAGELSAIMSRFSVEAASGSFLRLRNMTITGVKDAADGINGRPFTFSSTEGQRIIFENVRIVMTDDTTYKGGALVINGSVIIEGQKRFVYESSQNIRIGEDASLAFDLGTSFEYMPDDEKGTHLKFVNKNSKLVLNGATLFAPLSTGLVFERGNLVVDHRSTLRQNASSEDQLVRPNKGFTVGSATEDKDFSIWVAPAAVIDVLNGFVTYREEAN